MTRWRTGLAIFTITAPAALVLAQDGVNPKADYVGPPIATATLQPQPCPQTAAPVLAPRTFLVVNNSASTLECRLRHPDLGGWSAYAALPPGARLIDRRLDVDQLLVHCKPPGRAVAFRAYPGERYSLLREPGGTDISMVRVATGG